MHAVCTILERNMCCAFPRPPTAKTMLPHNTSSRSVPQDAAPPIAEPPGGEGGQVTKGRPRRQSRVEGLRLGRHCREPGQAPLGGPLSPRQPTRATPPNGRCDFCNGLATTSSKCSCEKAPVAGGGHGGGGGGAVAPSRLPVRTGGVRADTYIGDDGLGWSTNW